MLFFRPLTFFIELKGHLGTVIVRARTASLVDASCGFSRCLSSRDELSIKHPLIQNYIDMLVKEYEGSNRGVLVPNSVLNVSERLAEIKPVVDLQLHKKNLLECLSSLQELHSEGKPNDDELQKDIEDEKQDYIRKIEEVDHKIFDALLPRETNDTCNQVVMEITAGVGGQEAMLFTRELFDMYCSYVEYKGWSLDGYTCDDTDIGGLRQASIFVSGKHSYRFLKYEAGVHRVQRIPATEKSGRLHTSTVSIVVLPQLEEVQVEVREKDLKIETKRSTGAGGQHVNKTESAVRLTHIPTGISVECQTDRSQIRNRKEAMLKLKAILYRRKIEEQVASVSSARKSQVKSSLRSEKIRTYNFNQDRITDHRIGGNIHNLSEFMNGNEMLDTLIEKLDINCRKELLLQRVQEVSAINQ